MSDADVNQILMRARRGDPAALPELIVTLQDELRRMASAHMRHERDDHTLQTTALVNEAYLRLVDHDASDWDNRRFFLAAAAQAMRRVLVHHARDRGRKKRGGNWRRTQLDDALLQLSAPGFDVFALDDALERLAAFDPDKVRIVELRFFSGLTIDETAQVLGSSPATVKRDWQVARAWLYRELNAGEIDT
ncbi:MAG TPA: sigma-70 family RNA polymerase sigma factor [Phycisphaerae bacterium]|nr:sigma-70 family RNA polymerase sigma factor [Phycisphaerae bacterium]HRW53310.1 sigma-70 family RNA polymerase sigma factor [Phycisphaerae bacterium]